MGAWYLGGGPERHQGGEGEDQHEAGEEEEQYREVGCWPAGVLVGYGAWVVGLEEEEELGGGDRE